MPHEGKSSRTADASSRAVADNHSSGISRPAVQPVQQAAPDHAPVVQCMIGDDGMLVWGKKAKHIKGKIFSIIGGLIWLNKVHYRLEDDGGNEVIVAGDDPAYNLYDPTIDMDEEKRSSSEESSYSIEESSSSSDGGSSSDDDDIYDKYPKITHPVLRPGHMNPYRHGIGAADTIALLAIDRKRLIARVGGDDPELIEEIEAEFAKLDALIKAINDAEEKPILEQLVKAQQEYYRAEDRSAKMDMEIDTSDLGAKLADLATQLQKIRNGVKKKYREELRELYEKIYWISQQNHDDRNAQRRKRQVQEVSNLAKEKGFELSYQHIYDYDFDEIEGPIQTAHHSEQRMIVSKEWLNIRQTILEDVQNALVMGNPQATIANISNIIVSMILNRSSCYACNAFLVAELISLWKDIARLLGCSWQQARDALKDIITFEVDYSVPYSDVENVEELDEQLRLAGWTVSLLDAAEASDDEAVHEKLSGGKISSEVKKEAKKQFKGKGKNEDKDEFIPFDEKKPAFSILERLSRRTAVEKALLVFFSKRVTYGEGMDILTLLGQLGFQYHQQPGSGLNCALYSIADQLERRYGLVIQDRDMFAAFVRKRANLTFNTMIDVLNSGGAVLAAVAAYLAETGIINDGPGLSITIWSNDHQEGLMEFKNVAIYGAGALKLVLYYNGVNHFDSLSGGF